jgi:hypothetical protein
MQTPRVKIYDNKGNSFSMRGFKQAVKQDTLKDAIPKSLITARGILTGAQIKKYVAEGFLSEINDI